MRVIGTNISMIRGDSESILVSMADSGGEERDFVLGDTIYFTVKENISTDKKVVQKIITEFTEGKALIELLPSDTDELRVKEYVYDIQLTRADGSVTTIIVPSKFSVLGDVTRE